MTKICRLLPLLAALVVLMTACSQRVREIPPVESAMAKAMKDFNREHYVDAQERFDQMSLDYAGSALMDSITYMSGECGYQMENFLLAADQFEQVVSLYPTSPLVDDARIRVADCYYELSPKYALDQSYTYRAIQEYQMLLDEYPDSKFRTLAEERVSACRYKLAFKDFKAAELYYRLNQWPAAIIYCNDILEDWYDQPTVCERAHFLKARCYVAMKLTEEARATLDDFLQTWPDSEYKEDAASELKALTE